MPNYTTVLRSQARQHSKTYSFNEEKEKAFIEGAIWTIDKLASFIRGHGHYESMMDKSTKDYLNKLSLADVRKFVSEMMDFEKVEKEEKGASDE